MSVALKALLGIAAAGALVAATFAYLIVDKKNALSAQVQTAQSQLQTKESALKKAQTDLKAKDTALADKDTALSAANSKAESLQASVSAAEKKASDLSASVSDAKAKVAEAEAKVQKINDALGGKNPAEIKAEALKAQEELNAVRAEQRVLQDQLQSANTEVQRVTQLLRNADKGTPIPGVSGKIETVNRTWNFVVLNVGDKDNVVRNAVLIVYRGNDYIGKVRVVSTEAHTAVADILPEWAKGDIQAGDDVLN